MRRAAAAVLLLAIIGIAYWAYSDYKKRQLQDAVLALVTDATAQVRGALQAPDFHAGEPDRLESHFKALGSATQRLSGLEGWRNAPLADAAQQYLDEAHALLRRLMALQRARDAALGGVNAITEHIRAARGRSSDWIRDAIALRQQMDRDYFDYRLAEGGLQKSLQTLPEARSRLAPLAAATPLIDDRPIAEARSRLTAQSAQLARQVEAARILPAPR